MVTFRCDATPGDIGILFLGSQRDFLLYSTPIFQYVDRWAKESVDVDLLLPAFPVSGALKTDAFKNVFQLDESILSYSEFNDTAHIDPYDKLRVYAEVAGELYGDDYYPLEHEPSREARYQSLDCTYEGRETPTLRLDGYLGDAFGDICGMQGSYCLTYFGDPEFYDINPALAEISMLAVNGVGVHVVDYALTGEGDVNNSINITGDTRLLLSLLAGCGFFVGIESWVSHMAAAFDIPSIVFCRDSDDKYAQYSDPRFEYMSTRNLKKDDLVRKINGIIGRYDCICGPRN